MQPMDIRIQFPAFKFIFGPSAAVPVNQRFGLRLDAGFNAASGAYSGSAPIWAATTPHFSTEISRTAARALAPSQ
jgi:hypothetical protein